MGRDHPSGGGSRRMPPAAFRRHAKRFHLERRDCRQSIFRNTPPAARCDARRRRPLERREMKHDVNIHTDKILILDFGAQYTQLIARRVREIGVYCEIWAWDHDPAEIARFAPKGIILSGGPESTTASAAPRAPQEAFDARLPLLGICYGMQTMAMQLGGSVEGGHAREFGHASVQPTAPNRLLDGLAGEGGRLDVWMSHGDR